MMNDLQAWRERKQAGERMTLPSGLVVTVRPVSLLALATQGKIPQTLVVPVQQVMESKASSMAVKDYPQFGKVLDLIVKACVSAPPLADFGDETCLGLDELPIEDKLAIFTWANAPGRVAAFSCRTGRIVAGCIVWRRRMGRGLRPCWGLGMNGRRYNLIRRCCVVC